MNIEAYNLDSLRKLVRDLFLDIPTTSKEYDPDQSARINKPPIGR